MWQIWKDRNKKCFDNIDIPPSDSAKLIISYACEIVEAFKSPILGDSSISSINAWTKPIAGITKLNTDGCWHEAKGKGGFGGIFRYSNGDWILGFYDKLTSDSSLETEVWCIYKGLEIILEKKLASVRIESDSLNAVNLVKEGNPGNHPVSVVINEAHYLMNHTNTSIDHIYRSAN